MAVEEGHSVGCTKKAKINTTTATTISANLSAEPLSSAHSSRADGTDRFPANSRCEEGDEAGSATRLTASKLHGDRQ